MISCEEALAAIEAHVSTMPTVNLHLTESLGYVLAEDLKAEIDSPPFDNAAMDGYTFIFDSLDFDREYPINTIIAAGDTRELICKPGNVYRVFTGAPVPKGADTVAMQEHVQQLENQSIRFLKEHIVKHAHIRPQGSQVKKGSLAMHADTVLSPGAIGYLASLGITKVPVYKKPKIGILITGSELVTPGQPLTYGQIYESNAWMLQAALGAYSIRDVITLHCRDTQSDTIQAVEYLLHQVDMLLVSGGISVGAFDFVYEALRIAGVQPIFYKVKQKPGKPLFFGIQNKKPIFGLPGNPASTLTCFYIYTGLALRKMLGFPNASIPITVAKLSTEIRKKPGLTHLFKGYYASGMVEVLEGQESYKLQAFTASNCIVWLDEQRTHFSKGEEVKIVPYRDIVSG